MMLLKSFAQQMSFCLTFGGKVIFLSVLSIAPSASRQQINRQDVDSIKRVKSNPTRLTLVFGGLCDFLLKSNNKSSYFVLYSKQSTNQSFVVTSPYFDYTMKSKQNISYLQQGTHCKSSHQYKGMQSCTLVSHQGWSTKNKSLVRSSGNVFAYIRFGSYLIFVNLGTPPH